MTAIAAHLETCPHCAPARPRMQRLVVAFGILCVVALALVVTMSRVSRQQAAAVTPLQEIAAALPRNARTVEARLAGMPWAPYRGAARSSESGLADSKAESVLARVAAAEPGTDAESLRAVAVAHLLRSRSSAALRVVRRAIDAHASNARLRSDAAAITLTTALESEDPQELPVALAHADAALREMSALPEALFNRALVLERMGLREHAVIAWKAYLAADGTSAWADEVRARLQTLDHPNDRQQFAADRPVAEAAAVRSDAEAVRSFVARHRQTSRAWGEVETLGMWAEAERAGDAAAADAQLRFARMTGSALRGLNGEALLDDAVRAIDEASPAGRASLIEAHAVYRQARLAAHRKEHSRAEPLLTTAIAAFEAGGSPMADVARYFRAMALYELQRVEESLALLLQLAATAGPSYRAHLGQVQWQLGMCHYVLGDWSAALAVYQLSASVFADLGETANEGFMRILLADLYDVLGDRERAWMVRVDGFRALSDASRGDRLHVSISGAARAELQAGRNDAAASLLAVASEEARVAAGPETTVLSFAGLASLRAAAEDANGASRALREARAVAEKLDAPVAARAMASLQVAEAAIITRREPERALALLREAESHYVRSKRNAWLPGVHLHQGRALRRLGRDDEALARLNAGIRELEKQRSSVSEADLRATVFDGAESLFAETIDLLTKRRAYVEALDLAERFRARTLLEELRTKTVAPRMGAALASDARPTFGPGIAVLEYVVLDERLVIFGMRGEDMQTSIVDVPRERLRAMVAETTDGIRARDDANDFRKAAAALREVLVSPAARIVAGASTVVFIPDRFLQQVPFAALYDTGSERYLVQDHAVAVAPSLRLLDALARERRPAAALDALVIGNPATGGELEPLPASEGEARAIAAMYGRSSLLLREDATRERFLREWRRAAVVHYSGHATIAASRGAAASLALAAGERADHVTAYEIAQLPSVATRLVVLAACDSFGRGQEHLETTPTLAHSFLAAGVPSVVGVLWPIDDVPARELFRAFHRHWTGGGAGVASALRQSQLAMLASSDPALRHPASWASAAVLGDPFQHHSTLQE